MAGLYDILNNARDALQAQQFGTSVTGQNISNVNTPGYVKREAVLTSRALGGRSFGTVEASLRRSADQFAIQRYLSATGLSSAASERDAQLASVEAVFNDFQGAGLGEALDSLFASFTALSANPSDPSLRSNVLANAEAFADRSQYIARQLENTRQDLFQSAGATISQINEQSARVAELNEQIANAVLTGQDAADLKDQRAQVLESLSQLVDIETIAGDNEEVIVQATGTTLVEGGFHRALDVTIDATGALEIRAVSPSGASTNVTAFLSGGQLAGIVEVRDSDLSAIADSLDQLVFDVANAINTQHSAGFGLDGLDGRNLFAVSGTPEGAAATLAVDPAIAGQPDFIGASGSAAGVPGDTDNAVALGLLANATLGSGSRTPSEAYAALIGDLGTRKNQAANDAQTRAAIVEQAFQLRESVSGVSLDEEFIALTKFQRAFEASSQVIATVDEMFDDLLSIIR